MEVKNRIPSNLSSTQVSENSKSKITQDPVLSQSKSQSKQGVGIDLSEASRGYQKAFEKGLEIAKNTSPIRDSRVAEIKSAIQKGTYQVDSGKVADGILMEAIRERLATKV